MEDKFNLERFEARHKETYDTAYHELKKCKKQSHWMWWIFPHEVPETINLAHDELWNQHPTTKDINSQKSNNLPDWKTYFVSLCKLEYKANELSFMKQMIKAAFDKCVEKYVNSSGIYQTLYSKQLGQTDICKKMEKAIKAVYDFAMNCVFRE